MKLFGKEISAKLKRDLIVRVVLICLSGAVLLTFAFKSAAWFALNNQVDGTGMSVVATTQSFDVLIATRTTEYDNTSVYGSDAALMKNYYSANDYEITATSAGAKGGIAFELYNQLADAENDNSRFLQPGSYGTMSFYLRPKGGARADGVTFDFSINTIGFAFKSETVDAVTRYWVEQYSGSAPDPTAEVMSNFLKGHFLFFTAYDSDAVSPLTQYDGFVGDGTFYYETDEDDWDAEKTAYLVNLYWVWPVTYDEILNGISTNKYPSEVNDFVEDNTGYFFASNQDSAEQGLRSLGYNEADQLIGEFCDFIAVFMQVTEE